VSHDLLFQDRILHVCVACARSIFLVNLFSMVEFLFFEIHVDVNGSGLGHRDEQESTANVMKRKKGQSSEWERRTAFTQLQTNVTPIGVLPRETQAGK